MKQGTLFLIVIPGLICHPHPPSPRPSVLAWVYTVAAAMGLASRESMEASGSLWVSLHCQRRSNRRAIQSLPGHTLCCLIEGSCPYPLWSRKQRAESGCAMLPVSSGPKQCKGNKKKPMLQVFRAKTGGQRTIRCMPKLVCVKLHVESAFVKVYVQHPCIGV